jgi:calcineurin-like phosphoesterase family protein
MIWFTSDTHFGHTSILGLVGRPWSDVDAMDEALIKAWNLRVKPDDTVYHLGDFSFALRHRTAVIFSQLAGRKHLLIGNHDEQRSSVLTLPWVTIERLAYLRHAKHRFILCHYPIESWRGMHHGSYMLHGHSHGSLRSRLARRFDVGVDVTAWGFAPVSIDTIMELGGPQAPSVVDHHVVHHTD